MPRPRRRYLRALPAAVAIGLIALLTLEPRPRQAPLSASTPWHCLVCGGLGTVDVLLNLALFVPLGFTLFRLGFGPVQSALLGLAVSAVVEALQATIVAGRDPSLSDLLTNTTGALLGALLARAAPFLRSPRPAAARKLAFGSGAVWLALLGFTGWAVQPAGPTGEVVLRRAPIVPHLDRFPGAVHSLSLNDVEREPGPLAAGTLSRGSLALAAEGVLLSWTEVTAPVADLVDEQWNTIAQLGQLGQKVTFSVRARSELLKLRAPSVKVYRAMPPPQGQTIAMSGRLAENALTASAAFGGVTRSAETRLTPGLGWMLILPLGFYPFDYRPEITSAVWTALPLLLVGFWWRKSRPHPAATASGGAVITALGLVAIPPLTGAAGQGWEAWISCGLALLFGWLAGYASEETSAAVPPRARSAASP